MEADDGTGGTTLPDSRPHRGYVTTGIGGSGAEKLEMEVSIERDGDVITSQIGDSSTLPLWP